LSLQLTPSGSTNVSLDEVILVPDFLYGSTSCAADPDSATLQLCLKPRRGDARVHLRRCVPPHLPPDLQRAQFHLVFLHTKDLSQGTYLRHWRI